MNVVLKWRTIPNKTLMNKNEVNENRNKTVSNLGALLKLDLLLCRNNLHMNTYQTLKHYRASDVITVKVILIILS